MVNKFIVPNDVASCRSKSSVEETKFNKSALICSCSCVLNINYCKLINIKSKQDKCSITSLAFCRSTERRHIHHKSIIQLSCVSATRKDIKHSLYKTHHAYGYVFYFLSNRKVGWSLLLKTIHDSSYSLHHHLQAQLARNSCDGIFLPVTTYSLSDRLIVPNLVFSRLRNTLQENIFKLKLLTKD